MPEPTRRQILGGAAAVAALGGPGCAPAPFRTGAPIVLIFIDQLRAEALGVAGNRFVRTPNLDRLAAESVRFETCVTNAPVCRPARVSLMTGQPVADHGIYTNALEPDPRILPSHVRRLRDEAGYHTSVVGKTHLHDGRGHFDDHLERLGQWGFADAVELPDPQQHWMRSAHSDWLTATTAPGDVDKYRRWQDYIQAYTWTLGAPDLDPFRLGTEDHLDSFCARTAVARILAYDRSRPLYLQVNFPGPHPPFDPPSEFTRDRDPWDPDLPLPILRAPEGPVSPIVQTYQQIKEEPWTEETARALRLTYYGKVELVDRCVGMVIDALHTSGLADEAWVIVMSDHGELLGDFRMTGKVLAYESAIRVPLMIRPPGGVAGWVDDGVVDLLDVVRTISAIGGLDAGDDPTPPLVERVLGGPAGAAAHVDKVVVFENMGYVGVRAGATKLGWDLASGRPVELYDRDVDPLEVTNLVQDPARRADVDRLVDELRARRPLAVDNWRSR